jgi:hypothetical protein
MKTSLHLPCVFILFVAIFAAHANAQQIFNSNVQSASDPSDTFNSNVQSASDPSDTPELPVAPIQPPVPISSSPTEVVEGSLVVASQIISGGEDAEVALNAFVQEENYNLANSSDIDQIVDDLESKLIIAPEQAASVAVTISTVVTADFLKSDISIDGKIKSSSIVAAVQNSINVLAQSSKFKQLVTVANMGIIKQGMISYVVNLFQYSGSSSAAITIALKQIEEIVEGHLETITVNSGSTDAGPLAQVSL